MALNYANASALPDGQPNLPDSLNNYMNTIKTAFAAEGGVNWVPASQAVGSKYQFVYAKIDSATGGTAAIEKVDSIVCDPNKPHPFIVGVQGSDKSQFPSHYVLVTGKKFDSNGNVTHPIADPANNNQTLEDYGHFQTRGYVKDPTDDLSGLSINAGNNVTILLTDPNGNKTGLDSDSHESDTIPLSAYYSDSLGDDVTGEAADGVDHFINVSRPAPGSYLLQVSGLSSGPYQVSIQVISTDGTLQQAATVSGQAHQGSITTYYLALSSNPGSSPTATAVIGDINGDGKVDCSDLAIVKASFGKSMNQSGFDPRADVNGDGIVNILDLSFVARQLPAGTVCE
jgi:hypothetical protein